MPNAAQASTSRVCQRFPKRARGCSRTRARSKAPWLRPQACSRRCRSSLRPRPHSLPCAPSLQPTVPPTPPPRPTSTGSNASARPAHSAFPQSAQNVHRGASARSAQGFRSPRSSSASRKREANAQHWTMRRRNLRDSAVRCSLKSIPPKRRSAKPTTSWSRPSRCSLRPTRPSENCAMRSPPRAKFRRAMRPVSKPPATARTTSSAR